MGSTNPMDELREAQENGVVIGLQQVSGLKPRLDIDVLLLTKPDTFNLFILALSELQDFANARDKMAFYQLASIHGLPAGLWDGVFDEGKSDPESYKGYCVHSSARFATWHRSYMGLYEQSLYAKMAEIVDRYPGSVRDKYTAALKEFRLPYWDYYRPRKPEVNDITTFRTGVPFNFDLPTIFTTEVIMVRRTLDDALERLENPLYRYSIPSELDGGPTGDDWKRIKDCAVQSEVHTVRHPVSKDDSEGDKNLMNDGMNAARTREPNTTYIRNLIIGDQTYESFAGNMNTPGASGNLEAIHNRYHNLLGGGNYKAGFVGWMSMVPVAAFDPVFWIHHSNVERYASIWQAAHPDRWGASDSKGVNLLGLDNLPFRKSRGASPKQDVFWTGDLVQDHKVYGSYYEDAYDPVNLKTPEDVKNRFRYLYEWSIRPGIPNAEFGPIPEEMKPLPVEKAQIYNYAGEKDGGLPVDAGPVADDGSQIPMAAAAPAADAPAAAEEEKVEPAEAPFVATPSEEIQQVDTAPVAPGTSTGKAFTNIPEGATDVAADDVDESKYYREWYVDDIVERLAFNGPFTIYYFIGEFTGDDTGDYAGQSSEAGFTYIFTSSRQLCDNCGILGDERQLVTDTSPITPILLDYIGKGLDDLTPAKVVPFLIANLKWRIVTTAGERKDPRTTPGFKVGISSKLAPRDGDGISGFLYQEFPQVIDAIIERGNRPTTDA